MFSARKNVLGHMQQGGYPSPFDRNMGTKMAAKAHNWLAEQITSNLSSEGVVKAGNRHSACLLGMRTRHYEVRKSLENAVAFGFPIRLRIVKKNIFVFSSNPFKI